MKNALRKIFPAAGFPPLPDGLRDAAAKAKLYLKRFITSPKLKMVAPLLMTTALVSDAITHQAPQPSPVWGHSMSATFGSARNASNDVEVPAPPAADCFVPQEQERLHIFTPRGNSWRGFYNMAVEGGSYSRALHDAALDRQIAACETSDSNRVRNYDASGRTIGLNRDSNLATNIREATHGIMHGLMIERRLSNITTDEALFSRLNRRLTAEAVAVTAEYVVAEEMALRGEQGLQQSLQSENSPMYRYFTYALGYAQKQMPRASQDRVLARAAAYTINYILRQPEFVAANSDDILREYLGELMQQGGERPSRRADFNRDEARKMGELGRNSISDGISLLTPQDLARVSPQVASIVDAMQRLNAQKLRYRAPDSFVANNPYNGLTIAKVGEQINLSGGIYTPRQAFERARLNRTYGNRAAVNANGFRFGLQGDYTPGQVPVGSASSLYTLLQDMRRASPTLGVPLLDFATESNIFMCYSELPNTLLGQWQPDAGVIVLTDRNLGSPNTLPIFAHELLHLMQNGQGIGGFTDTYNLEDMQMGTLSREAAASTMQYLLALDYKLHGNDALWNANGDHQYQEQMLQVYNRARSEGMTYEQALEQAGLEGFGMMFQRQWWLDIYNRDQASGFLNSLVNGFYKKPSDNRYPLERMRLAGRVTENFNFTRNLASEPSDQMRFGNNDAMRDLFAWLDYQHMVKAYGADHEVARAAHHLMEEHHNRYLKVEFAPVAARVHDLDGQKLVALMNGLAGLGPMPEFPAPGTRAAAPSSRFVCR